MSFGRFIDLAFLLFLTTNCSSLAVQTQRTDTPTAMPSLPKIVQVDFKTLRTPAQPVPLDQIQTPEVQSFIKTMVEVMRSAPGVGLAAPQIGDPRQIIVLEDRQAYIESRMTADEAHERGRYAFPLKVIINPKLTLIQPSGHLRVAKFTEGCLSVEGYGAEVERALEVKVEGWDENAKPFEWQVSGWPARILQHEVDHLNSTLYIDRMDSKTFKTYSKQDTASEKEPTLPEILSVGDPILRTRSEPVKLEEMRSPKIQAAISTMINVMKKQPLVGLAAPQIGILNRIIVLEDREEYISPRLSQQERERRERAPFPLKVIINPKLTFIDSISPLSATFPEASPCIKNFQGNVERLLEVKVEGWDENGDPIEWQTRGWPARILQHEVDHLDGILYIDRMDRKTFKFIPPA